MSAPLSIPDYRQPVEFRIGDVLIRSWKTLSRHFLAFAVLVGIADLLSLLLNLYWTAGSKLMGGLPILLVRIVLTSFADAIVIVAAFQDLRGRPVSIAESFRQAVSRLAPVLATAILLALLLLIGLLFCLVPGLYVLTAMAVVMPACVVERLGPIQSMSRSSALTSGRRWPILGVGVAVLFIELLVSWAIRRAMPSPTVLPAQLLDWVWQVLWGSYEAVYAAILYHDLRALREGIGIDEIASVFD